MTVKNYSAEGSSPPLFDILINLEYLRNIRFEDLPNKTVGRMDAGFVSRALERRLKPIGYLRDVKTLLGCKLFGPKIASSLTSSIQRLGNPCFHS